MEEEHHIPNAFFAFGLNVDITKHKDIPKYQLRKILADEIKNYLPRHSTLVITPWKFNLFHIKEFEVVHTKNLPEAIEELKKINGKDPFKSYEISYMSSNDITITRSNAVKLLEDHPHAKAVVEKARDMKLDYIIQGIFEDRSLIRVNYRNDTKVYEALRGIVARLSYTEIALHNTQFKKQFYAYTKDNELQIVYS
jgi:hypothetical protein